MLSLLGAAEGEVCGCTNAHTLTLMLQNVVFIDALYRIPVISLPSYVSCGVNGHNL